ncbi:hypothetical protein GCM10009654_54230 [Streptomyces hebeiensis]|uniref:Uncharacterized protein n=1 Tax=Streptomyces hebeiensis TaxID=229486 RepID=A0ABP4FQ95_9ACTN
MAARPPQFEHAPVALADVQTDVCQHFLDASAHGRDMEIEPPLTQVCGHDVPYSRDALLRGGQFHHVVPVEWNRHGPGSSHTEAHLLHHVVPTTPEHEA